MGPDAMDVYRIKRKPDSTDTLAEVQKFMKEHFVVKKSEYSEIVIFRRAFRHESEIVNEYAMRSWTSPCQALQFRHMTGQRDWKAVRGWLQHAQGAKKCTRVSDLDLAKVFSFANGYERVYAGLDGL